MIKRITSLIIISILCYFTINAFRIYIFSGHYSEKKSDVAIILGAGTNNGNVSPVFRERINHGIYLYEKKIVYKLIFTGGYGKGQEFSDSKVAKNYAVKNGIPESVIFIEEKSKYTYQNLREAKEILDSLHLKDVLIVSDPLHMKRSMLIADEENIDCKPSPTKTSMYRSKTSKIKSLMYEAFYFSLREIKSIFL